MIEYFKPYEGTKPFVFVSYSHQDSKTVLKIITPLHKEKYRVWYDEGIPAGCDWPANIASHMQDAAAVLFFLSARSLDSANCFNEIQEALQQHKPVLCVWLEDAIIPPDWVPMIEKTAQLRDAYKSEKPLDRTILEQVMISPDFLGDGTNDIKKPEGGQRINGWIIGTIAGVLILIATAVGTYGLTNHWFDSYLQIGQPTAAVAAVTPEPTAIPTALPTIDPNSQMLKTLSQRASFPDDQQERAVRQALDQPDGDVLASDLFQITQLHFCGNMALQSDAGIAFDRDGNCSVNSAPVIRGSISDLSLISGMQALERLSLVYQNIDSIDQLAPLERLTELNVAGNPIESIGDLSRMLSLQKLSLEHTGVRDLSTLGGLQQLKTVTVSADMFPLTFDKSTQKFDVVLAH